MKKYLSSAAAILLAISLTGCASESKNGAVGDMGGIAPSGGATGGGATGGGESIYAGTDIGGTGIKGGSGDITHTGFATDATMEVAGDTVSLGDMGGTAYYEPGDAYEEPANTPEPQAGMLTGGEWNDNEHWSDWDALYYSHEDWRQYKEEWDIPFDCRIAVKVTANGKPLEGAEVSCANAISSAVTDNKGMAYLFYKAINGPTADIVVEYDGVSKTLGGVLGDSAVECDLGDVTAKERGLDLMIMCDTTGSMADELEYLKVELKDIVRRISRDNPNTDIRTSVNFYRDEGDEYVVRQFPFTDDIEQSVDAITAQSSDGGGDFPEAVHTALDSAINEHEWNEDNVKILFLVLDAPPHSDPQIIDSVHKYVSQAAEKGIRIIPVASSGIDKSTEYLLRTMAFSTGGTYTFLTDDSGIGGSHIEPTVGAFNVEALSDMLVRIVNGYLE